MSKEIGIGLLIGLVVLVLTLINRSESFSKEQKIFLWVACIIFFPAGLLALLIIYLYNSNKTNVNKVDRPIEKKHNYSPDKSTSKQHEHKPKSSSINEQNEELSLRDLKSSITKLKMKIELVNESFDNDLLTEEETRTKTHLLNSELNTLKKEHEKKILINNILSANKSKIDKLESLVASDLLTQSECDKKVNELIEFEIENLVAQKKGEPSKENISTIDKKEEIQPNSKRNWLKVSLILIMFILIAFAVYKVFNEETQLNNKTKQSKDPDTNIINHNFGTVEDFDGQTYKTVQINGNEWLAKNLNVSHFNNGDPISQAKTEEEWFKAGEEGKPAWCYYNNDKNNEATFGKLYNWHAVNDPRGLAPKGWHVATINEFEDLSNHLGGEDNSGEKLKSNKGWENPAIFNAKKHSGNGTNESGFTGLPGGGRFNDEGEFGNQYVYGHFWCGSDRADNEDDPTMFELSTIANELYSNYSDKINGFSVRCVSGSSLKNQNNQSMNGNQQKIHVYGSVVDIDGNNYKTVTIGDQIWMAENLRVKHFINGDPIKKIESAEDWVNAFKDEEPAWCYYYNDPNTVKTHGILYNYWALFDPRGLAPTGWITANEKSYNQLMMELGGEEKAGPILRSKNRWKNKYKGKDVYGFDGYPWGRRSSDGEFINYALGSLWLKEGESKTINYNGHYNHHTFSLNFNSRTTIGQVSKGGGLPIRCLKNK
jgi:uncharacterized protein (TIGR02145 family)